MKTLLTYLGTILILLVVIVLAVSFFTDALMDADSNHWILGVSAILIIIGILLNIFLGRKFNRVK